jgi:hypothetical protein
MFFSLFFIENKYLPLSNDIGPEKSENQIMKNPQNNNTNNFNPPHHSCDKFMIGISQVNGEDYLFQVPEYTFQNIQSILELPFKYRQRFNDHRPVFKSIAKYKPARDGLTKIFSYIYNVTIAMKRDMFHVPSSVIYQFLNNDKKQWTNLFAALDKAGILHRRAFKTNKDRTVYFYYFGDNVKVDSCQLTGDFFEFRVCKKIRLETKEVQTTLGKVKFDYTNQDNPIQKQREPTIKPKQEQELRLTESYVKRSNIDDAMIKELLEGL